MARQVLPWVGAVVGAYFGNPQLGFMIGSMIGNAVDPQVIQGPKLGEGQDNTASEGGYRPIVLGKGAIGVCMIHEGPLRKRTIRHRQSKGGGPVTTEERAYRTMAFALGESAYPETGVQLSRLWIDNKLRYDVTPTSQIVAESMQFSSEFAFYPGDNTQEPDPDLEAFLGPGNVPSYRGGAPYIVFPNWDVTDSRGMAPMIKAELVSAATQTVGPYFTTSTGQTTGVIRKSVDMVSWTTLNTGLGKAPRVIKCLNWQLFVLADGVGVVSSDEGLTFEDVEFSPAIPPSAVPTDMDWSSETGYVITFSAQAVGVYRSPDGRLFTRIHSNGPSVYNSVAVHGLQICVGLGFGGRVLVSLNGGGTFSIQESGMSYDVGFVTHNGSAFIVAEEQSNQVRFRLDLSSGSWGSAGDVHSGNTNTYGLSCAGGQAVLIAGSGRTAYSAENISDWNEGETIADFITLPNSRSATTEIDGVVYTIGTTGQLYRYLGHGAWELVSTVPGSASYNGIAGFNTRTVTGGKIPLHTVISWVHDRVDMPAWKYDVGQLDDMVEGIVFADGYTAADAVRTQMALYFFDAGEFDGGAGYRINYVKRGGAASVTLTEDDIVDGPEDWEREDSYERPRVLHVAYQNPIVDYGAPNITIKRTSPDVLVVGEKSLSVPNVFSDVDEITRRSDIMMTVVYAEIAGDYEITVPLRWLELVPTDNIGFSIRSRVRRLRMTTWKFNSDGTIVARFRADRQSAYTSNVTGLPVVPPTVPPSNIVGATVSAALDIPALVDSLDSLHLIVAASGQTPAWYGATHQYRLPFDSDFSVGAQFNPPSTVMGLLLEPISAASEHYTDVSNTVRVVLYSDDELETHTQQEFLSERGAFAVSWEDNGVQRWEVMQYRDAVKVGDREWELRVLLRGRLNTDAVEHPIGSMFVLLDSGIRAIPTQVAWLDETITHRAVSHGELPDDAGSYSEPYYGESQREWPVAHVVLKVVGGDVSVRIVPRHRFGTEDHPIRSANWDGYRVEATDGANSFSTDVDSESVMISTAGWSGVVTVTVSQLNRFTGAGPAISETIEL